MWDVNHSLTGSPTRQYSKMRWAYGFKLNVLSNMLLNCVGRWERLNFASNASILIWGLLQATNASWLINVTRTVINKPSINSNIAGGSPSCSWLWLGILELNEWYQCIFWKGLRTCLYLQKGQAEYCMFCGFKIVLDVSVTKGRMILLDYFNIF